MRLPRHYRRIRRWASLQMASAKSVLRGSSIENLPGPCQGAWGSSEGSFLCPSALISAACSGSGVIPVAGLYRGLAQEFQLREGLNQTFLKALYLLALRVPGVV
ncbi:hypothetical protein D9M70_463000 [compost metagenome]